MFGNLTDSLMKQITAISIESKYTPPLFLDKPFEPRPDDGEPGIIAKMKPRITLYTKNYAPFVSQPFGNPDPSQWPAVKIATIATSIVIILGLIGAGYKLGKI